MTSTQALWECFLLSGADPSQYAIETRTERGRAAGLLAFARDPKHREMAVEAVRQLRADYDEESR